MSVYAGSYNFIDWWNADTFGNDQYSQAKIGSVVGSYGGVAVRCASAAATCYLWVHVGSGVFRLRKLVNNSYTQIGSDYNTGVTPATGDLYKLSVSGTTLTPSFKGVDYATQTDSDISSGSAGITGYYDARIDDWEGGNVGIGALSITVTEALAFAETLD